MRVAKKISFCIVLMLMTFESASAGELSFGRAPVVFLHAPIREPSQIGTTSEISWKTGCNRPVRYSAILSEYDPSPSNFNRDVNEFNRWLSQVETYRSCVRSEAEADSVIMTKIIVDSVKREFEDISTEISRHRSKLEMMRR